MDFTINTDKKVLNSKDVAVTASELDTLWNLLEESIGNLPIHSREGMIKANGCVIYWLKLISK